MDALSRNLASPALANKLPGDQIKISLDHNGLLIANAANQIQSELAPSMMARREKHLEMLKLAQQSVLTPEMRREDAKKRLSIARLSAMSEADYERLYSDFRDAALRRGDQIGAAIKQRIAMQDRMRVTDKIKWRDLFVDPPVDHSFWWAETQPYVTEHMQADFREDGLHFFGGPKVDGYDSDEHTSFGAVALFALQPERFPSSPSGVFLSSPHIELFGGITAFAPDWDLPQGSGIASCKMYLRQTLFQWGFGETGPVPMHIAEAKGYETSWEMYAKNTGYSIHADLPGFKLIPAVTYNKNQLAPNALMAEIEVRFDIFLKNAGALVWPDPDVLLRTFQWAVTPLP